MDSTERSEAWVKSKSSPYSPGPERKRRQLEIGNKTPMSGYQRILKRPRSLAGEQGGEKKAGGRHRGGPTKELV